VALRPPAAVSDRTWPPPWPRPPSCALATLWHCAWPPPWLTPHEMRTSTSKSCGHPSSPGHGLLPQRSKTTDIRPSWRPHEVLPHRQLHLPQSHICLLQRGGVTYAALHGSTLLRCKEGALTCGGDRSRGRVCLAALAKACDTFFSLIYSLSYPAPRREPVDIHYGCP
jgi:hypothetical protein